MKRSLEKLLSKVHPPQELSYRHGVAFARYGDINQACRVIMKCNKATFNGTVVTIKPAIDRSYHAYTNESKITSESIRTKNQADNHTPCRPKTILGQRDGGGRTKPQSHTSEQHELMPRGMDSSGHAPFRIARGRKTSSYWRGGGLVFGINGRMEIDKDVPSNQPTNSSTGYPPNETEKPPTNGSTVPRPMAAQGRVAPAGSEVAAKGRNIKPDTPPTLPGKKGNGLLSILSLSPRCANLKEEEEAERDADGPLNQAAGETAGDSGDVGVQVWRREQSPKRAPSKSHNLFSDDSLDEDDWDWSLLPPSQHPSPATPSAGHTHHPSAPSPLPSDPDESVKLFSPVQSLKEEEKKNSSRNGVLEESSFWSEGTSPVVSRRTVVPRDELQGAARFSVEKLIPVTVSKIETPEQMWVQMDANPQKILEAMSLQIYEARPPKIEEASLGKLCCLMMPMPSQKDKQLLIRRALIKENSNKHVTEPQVGIILIDVGNEFQCAIKDLRVIPKGLGLDTRPPLASPLALKGVASSYYGGNHWYSLDLDTIGRVLKNQMVYMVEQSKDREEFSKCGHTLVTMYMDPEATDNVADKLIRDCYFVVRSTTHRKEQALTGRVPLPNSVHNGMSPTSVKNGNDGASGGVAKTESAPPTARKRRSMMEMLTRATAQANQK